jgi:protein CpxP
VRLMPTQSVKSYVKTSRSEQINAEAVADAVSGRTTRRSDQDRGPTGMQSLHAVCQDWVTRLRQPRFAGDLNLTDDQKQKLQGALTEAREKVEDYLKDNPNATKADIIAKVKAHRDEIRQRVVNFLSSDQLSKWDSEIAKAKEFLGQKVDA